MGLKYGLSYQENKNKGAEVNILTEETENHSKLEKTVK
jgi:hypothetical protein